MKRFIFILLPLLVLGLIIPAHATVIASLAGQNETTNYQFGGTAQTIEIGQCVAVSAGGTLSTLDMQLRTGSGSPTGAYTVGAKIYSPMTGSPSAGTCAGITVLAISPTTFIYSAISSTYATYHFDFSTVTLTANQVILWVVTFTIAGTCTITCYVQTQGNSVIDLTQSSMDNYPTGVGPPGAPGNLPDNTICNHVDFCMPYVLNTSGAIPPPATCNSSCQFTRSLGAGFTILVLVGIVTTLYQSENSIADKQIIRKRIIPAAIAIGIIAVVLVLAGL